MKIETTKDLTKLINLCHKHGVKSIKVDGIELELAEKPSPKRKQVFKSLPTFAPGGITDDTQIETPDDLSDEQKLFWSSIPGTEAS